MSAADQEDSPKIISPPSQDDISEIKFMTSNEDLMAYSKFTNYRHDYCNHYFCDSQKFIFHSSKNAKKNELFEPN